MSTDLSGRVVLLTGASGGIGSVTAALLLERGAQLVAHYGDNRRGVEAACAGAPADQVMQIQVDLSQRGASRELWRRALAWRGQVDVVIANAAIAIDLPFSSSDEDWDDGWERTLRVNATEPANLMRAALPHFIERRQGVLIAISSWAAQRGSALPSHTAYAASKAALQSLTQSIARNHTADGVLAYVVAPGIVNTPMSQISATARGGVDAVNAMLPLGEMVPPAEVAELIACLAGGTLRHLAGATLDLNGAANIR